MTSFSFVALATAIVSVMAAPSSHPKGVSSNAGPLGNNHPGQNIIRRFFGDFGGCGGGCDFGPAFFEEVCCVDENCFHEDNLNANTEAAFFCENVCCNDVDANCFNEFNEEAFFIC